MKKTIVTILGARPQFVKAAVVSRAIAQHNLCHPYESIREVIVHTGQHFDRNMSDVFFEQMQIPEPDHFLEISNLSHGAMTGRMLEKIEDILLSEMPDIVLVYGDTNSTLAGALAAAKLHIPVAHVEAGLRSFNMKMPEEINRILTDRISKWLFCPTDTALSNLKREGLAINAIDERGQAELLNVGDVMYDATLYYKDIAKLTPEIERLLTGLTSGFLLSTIHRAENTDDPQRLEGIIEGLDCIASEIPVILPLHPRTRKKLEASGKEFRHVSVISPVGYFDMLGLLERCNAVLTDSGGMQKEAFFFKKPCVTLRDETEWVELVDGEYNLLAGTDPDRIVKSVKVQTNKDFDWNKRLYGDGNAAEKILASIMSE